jgi:hypothetical protein
MGGFFHNKEAINAIIWDFLSIFGGFPPFSPPPIDNAAEGCETLSCIHSGTVGVEEKQNRQNCLGGGTRGLVYTFSNNKNPAVSVRD